MSSPDPTQPAPPSPPSPPPPPSPPSPPSLTAGTATRPERALAELLAGNQRFAGGQPRYGHYVASAQAVANGQDPFAVVLGCMDSRVPLEAVFDQDFGRICVIRSGGHVLDRAVLGSVEFAVTGLDVALVMVLGHRRCGAVQASVDAVRTGTRPPGQLSYLVDEIDPDPDADPEAVMRTHVRRTVGELRRLSALRSAPSSSAVRVVGAVYDLDSGRVEILD